MPAQPNHSKSARAHNARVQHTSMPARACTGKQYRRSSTDYVRKQLEQEQQEELSLRSVVKDAVATMRVQELVETGNVNSMPIRDLKLLIATAGMSTEGCLEISELRARANQARHALVANSEQTTKILVCG